MSETAIVNPKPNEAASPDGIEHLDVLVIGAGLSGIGAAHHLETSAPWAKYAILEARHAIGGTWDLFRYPGIRSDSDMFTFGYSLRPWTSEKTIGEGADILNYIRETAQEAGVDRKIRFGHRILSAAWSSDTARWSIVGEKVDADGEVVGAFELTCGFLFSCTGYYRYDRGHTPDFDGLDRFAGEVVHPQAWPEDLDYSEKRIVVIGSGATAVTLIPNLSRTAAKVTMLQRSPSYVAAAPSVSYAAKAFHKLLPAGAAGRVSRGFHAVTGQAFFAWCRNYPKLARRVLIAGMRRELPKGYDVDRHFTPAYDPWDQRLCLAPDGDFFRAIKSGKADVVTDTIDSFTETGIRLASGEELGADIVVTATGLELLFLGGIEVTVDGEPLDAPSRMTYRGMMLEGVPNLAIAIGYTNASWTLKADLTCAYVPQLLNEMRLLGQSIATPVNNDPTVETEAVLSLTSGYIQRSSHLFPLQGTESPWRNHQRYATDYRDMMRTDTVGEGLVLSSPELASPSSPKEQAAAISRSG